MPWHAPITWQVDQLVTEGDLNAQIRDNMLYLKGRADRALVSALPISLDISTSSTQWSDIQADTLSIGMVTAGGPVLLGFSGVFSTTSTAETVVQLDFSVDGLRYVGGEGLAVANVRSGVITLQHDHVLMQALVMNLAAGSHTFRPQWRLASGVSVLLRGGNTAGAQFRPHLWAIEF
ncbi:MAG: hypothetical protein NZ750_08905 [Anaerolineae bacterium]|nr:hypothetical protein [Anaerolineae bacterium]MDW8171736.1 hypothetical protein [Anaerolineae bacterium]